MRTPPRVVAFWSCVLVFVLLGTTVPETAAATYTDASRFFQQPNGTSIEVRLFGTELYLRAESPDGYALAIDRPSGWICYAEKAADGGLKSSGVHYLGTPDAVTLAQLDRRGITTKLRADSASVAATVAAVKQSLEVRSGGNPESNGVSIAAAGYAPKYVPVLGSGKGLVVLVDFSDRVGSILPTEYDKAFNGDTYDSLGSVRTWIEAISYGKYTAAHTVVGYMRAAYPTSHYVGGTEFDYSASRELMKQVFAYIDENVDLTSYAASGAMPSLVVIYPGAEIAKVWATGLWPHSGEGGYTTSEGVRIPNAFISNGGTQTPVKLTTFRHELGHSLFNWPDTYDYDSDSAGAGGYATETTLPCAPFRAWTGWLNVIDVIGLNQAYALPANGDTCLRYKNTSNASEFFIVEYMRKDSVKRADAPDEGLLIWHVDEKGDNSAQDMTAAKHYPLSVEQADGLFELEKNGTKRAGDLYRAGYKDTFNDTTTPNSKWWNGTASGFAVCNVGALDPSMNVTIGCSGTITPIADAGLSTGDASPALDGRAGSGGVSGAGGAGPGGAGGSTGARDAGSGTGRRDSATADVGPDLGSPGVGGATGRGGNTGEPSATGGTPGSDGAVASTGGNTQAGGSAGGTVSAGGNSGSGGKLAADAGKDPATQTHATDASGCSCTMGAAGAGSGSPLLIGLFLGSLALALGRRRTRGQR